MNTVNFSKNNINDILKQAKQIETEQTLQNLKKKPVTKHLNQIESTGVLDAINYAPKRGWQHSLTHIPVSDYIDKSFVNKHTAIKDTFDDLEKVQNEKQWYKNSRNGLGVLAVGAGIAAATMTPLGQLAGLGYLAGWANAAITTSVIAAAGGLVTQGISFVNKVDEKEKVALDDFTKSLGDYAKDNISDMHKYWNAVDKLSKVPMSQEQALNTLSNLYTEANNSLRQSNNVSLVDVYLNAEDKGNLKSYGKVDTDSYTATSLSKDMKELPQAINDDNNFYLEKGSLFSNDFNAPNTIGNEQINDDNLRLNKVLGFKLHVLENAGVSVNKKSLDLADDASVDDVNKALNKRYGAALDDAFLIYQGKHSMAAPIVDKVEKVLQNALELFSKEAIKQAKARNLKKVPEITGQLVEKILSAVMLQTSIPANDTKLTKILNAIANNTALKVAANLNNYASDTGKAEKNKALYAEATLDDLYGKSLDARINDQIIRLNPNSDKDILTVLNKMSLSEENKKTAQKEAIKKLEEHNNIKLYPVTKNGETKLMTRRWKNIPVASFPFAPNLFGKEYVNT